MCAGYRNVTQYKASSPTGGVMPFTKTLICISMADGSLPKCTGDCLCVPDGRVVKECSSAIVLSGEVLH